MSVTKIWKVYKSKWGNKDEYNTVKDVRERFEEMLKLKYYQLKKGKNHRND